jgi:uncharacterized membrane protein YesL
MKGLFDFNNPFMSFINKLADLMILNALTLICCLPIVTVGASLSSMYYVLLRLRKEETSFVTKDFFHAFRQNLRQGIILWILYLSAIIVLAAEYYLIFVACIPELVEARYAVYLFTVLVLISLTWSFVLLSRYNNSVGRIIINSYFIGFTHFVRTIMMALLMMSPMALILIYPAATPVIMVIGLALPGYLQTFFFIQVFEGLEQPQTDDENAQV